MEEGNLFLGDVDLSYCIYAVQAEMKFILRCKGSRCWRPTNLQSPLLDEFRIGATAYTGILKESAEYMHITIDKATVDKPLRRPDRITSRSHDRDVQSRIQQLISKRLRNRIILDLLPPIYPNHVKNFWFRPSPL